MARGPASDGHDKPPPAGATGDDRRTRVGDALRKAYDDALDEPVPDIFADLLRKLG
jgi:hypothetical protein